MKLRDYQIKAKQEIYKCFAKNQKVLLWMFTGSGKTKTFCSIINEMMRDYFVIVVVKTRKLVTQSSNELTYMGIKHGIYMAKSSFFAPSKKVQVCSIDTLRSRQHYPHIDCKNVVIIIDEADESKSNSYQNFIKAYPKAFILGVTATPYNDLNHFDKIICPIKPHELRDQNYLVPFRLFAPVQISTIGVDIVGDDYNQKQLYKKSSGTKIIGNIVEDWKKFSQERNTLLFAVNIKHSKEIARRFNDEGIPAIHCDANNTDKERLWAIDSLEYRNIKVICNVRLFTRGISIDRIGCIQDCAPTRSLNLYIQKLGRGTRLNFLYSDCILIDNAGNCLLHGDPYLDREVRVNGFPVISLEKAETMQTCIECLRAYDIGPKKCPYCEKDQPIKQIQIKEIKGEIKELSQEEIEKQRFINEFRKLRGFAKFKKIKQKNFVFNSLINKFGIEKCIQFKNEINIPQNFIEEYSFNSTDNLKSAGIL